MSEQDVGDVSGIISKSKKMIGVDGADALIKMKMQQMLADKRSQMNLGSQVKSQVSTQANQSQQKKS
ncbi:hypothetical protein EBZ35_00135 [bacterium]|nr:hypothetical protein [bacterium]